ncbi:MAG: YmdB family metallophosphoesterase [Deltaproteobacteria bacterium]|jgi:metallophosphoesterase (TIGR00282 family)|nr:YmdB family metallophosphoesterase [Deltaproteobacteria bacterium]
MTLKILFLGDVFSQTGRDLVRQHLPGIVSREGIDISLANGENASGGRGITRENARELLSRGLAALSGGNHTFQQGGSEALLDEEPRLLRPYNFPEPCPGGGWILIKTAAGFKVAFGNLMGRVFLQRTLDCPFRAADRMLHEMSRAGAEAVIIDFHAEATAEKKAMGYYLDGRASAVLGTHTHVQTADAHILPGGTAYITDLGMSGAQDTVIGMEKDEVIRSLIDGRRHQFKPGSRGGSLEGVILEIDGGGKALSIKTVNHPKVFRTTALEPENVFPPFPEKN